MPVYLCLLFQQKHQPHPNGFQRRNHRHICRCTSRFYHLSCSVFGRNSTGRRTQFNFITLPNVFQQAFSGIPILAYIFSVMFYVLLALAALTSTISLHEVVTAYLHEEFNFTRGKAARLVTTGCILLGILCSLSLGVTKEFTIFGLGMFLSLIHI